MKLAIQIWATVILVLLNTGLLLAGDYSDLSTTFFALGMVVFVDGVLFTLIWLIKWEVDKDLFKTTQGPR